MKEWKNKWKNKKKLIQRVTIVFFVTLFISSLLAGMASVSFLRDVLRFAERQRAYQEEIYSLEQLEGSNCEINREQMITTGSPAEIMLGGINKNTLDVTLHFAKPLEQALEIVIYYAKQEEAFTEERTYRAVAEKDAEQVYFKLRTQISQIKFQINAPEQSVLYLGQVVLNEKFSLGDVLTSYIENYKSDLHAGIALVRIQIFFCVFFFVGMHFIVKPKKLYAFLFAKRWLVAGGILLFLVCNRYHGDSLGLYDNYIQTGLGSNYVQPVLGVPRAIRSDEWVVDAGSRLSSRYSDLTQKYNSVLRGTDTLKAPTGGIYLGYATLGARPFQFAWAILDTEYAYSFCWYAPIILAFMVTLELFLILSRGKKWLSVAGAFLVIGSSFYMWWSFPAMLLGANGALVCAYYFVYAKSWRKKILFALGTALAAANFALTLYPAWQVPLGYVVLALLVGLIYENWEQIKKMKKWDYVIMGCALFFMASLLVSYFMGITEYTSSIMHTVYPGKRLEAGGGGLRKLFYYFQAPLYAYKDIGNPSEAGVFFSLFPIPTIMAGYLWIKSKKKDWLTGGLLLVTAVFVLYAVVPFPSFFANITFLKYVTNVRLLDIIGLLQIFFIVMILARFEEVKRMPKAVGAMLGVGTGIGAYAVCNQDFPSYCNMLYSIFMLALISWCAYCLLCENAKKTRSCFIAATIFVSIITSIYIRPISRGLDSIYSKPVAKAIEEIVAKDKQAKWITEGIIESSFLIMCGAPTINSVNMYPNLELWEKLDENHLYEDVYNRYAHVHTTFTQEATSFELLQVDLMNMNLSYQDFQKAEIAYVFSLKPLEQIENAYETFDLIYEEGNAYIYQVRYK